MGLPAALFGCLATAACLGVTLYGGLGTIATGGADLRAQSVKVSEMLLVAERFEMLASQTRKQSARRRRHGH